MTQATGQNVRYRREFQNLDLATDKAHLPITFLFTVGMAREKQAPFLIEY